MWTHIAKALQSRCKAIRNAVKTYNTAAAQLNPPHPPISWESISHINFLEEFTLLHDTHQEIHEKQWSQPAVRELMKLSQWVKRAQEEIQWCYISIRRLYTAIHDENDFFRMTLSRIRSGNLLIYGAVHDFIALQQQANDLLLSKFNVLTNSPDYSSNCSRGVWVGSFSGEAVGSLGQSLIDLGGVSTNHDDDNNEEHGADETDEMVGQFIDFVSDLTLLPWDHIVYMLLHMINHIPCSKKSSLWELAIFWSDHQVYHIPPSHPKHLIYWECLSVHSQLYDKPCCTLGPWGSSHTMQLSRSSEDWLLTLAALGHTVNSHLTYSLWVFPPHCSFFTGGISHSHWSLLALANYRLILSHHGLSATVSPNTLPQQNDWSPPFSHCLFPHLHLTSISHCFACHPLIYILMSLLVVLLIISLMALLVVLSTTFLITLLVPSIIFLMMLNVPGKYLDWF